MAMRILMLGWEFPPFIAGGLGVACYGLTKALDRLGHEVIFILPKPVDRSHASHVRMLSPLISAARANGGHAAGSIGGGGVGGAEGGDDEFTDLLDETGQPLTGFAHATFRGVPAHFS